MPTYTTEKIRNIGSGLPFTFDVDGKDLERLENQKRLVEAGSAPLLGHSVVELVENFEFSLFPSFKDVLKIFISDGFPTDLITKILEDFGANEAFIRELLKNERFIQEVRPWFSGITCDGGRAIRTLRVVYLKALTHWKIGAMNAQCYEERSRPGLPGGGE